MPQKSNTSQARGASRLADHVDSDTKEKMIMRLKRAEGQIRGIQKMVAEERYCPDILVQVSAVHQSLRAVERMLLANHLQHCATNALRSRDRQKAEKTYNELVELFYRHAR